MSTHIQAPLQCKYSLQILEVFDAVLAIKDFAQQFYLRGYVEYNLYKN